jgi:hypothetical protein
MIEEGLRASLRITHKGGCESCRGDARVLCCIFCGAGLWKDVRDLRAKLEATEAERDRWAARVKLLEERIGHSVDVLRGRADAMFDEESVAETDRILRFFGFDRLADETADEEANRA